MTDTERWLPEKNPRAHELTREGWPWFGDEMELLINASNLWKGGENAAGDGTSWQMVCNLTKSRLGGVGVGVVGDRVVVVTICRDCVGAEKNNSAIGGDG